jgi:hypothetical protein
MISLDNWDGNLMTVYDAENAVRRDSDAYNTQQIRSHLEELVDIGKKQETKFLQDIFQALQEQASLHMGDTEPPVIGKRIRKGSTMLA